MSLVACGLGFLEDATPNGSQVAEADALACEEVRSEHLFLALARDEESEAYAAISGVGSLATLIFSRFSTGV